MTGNYDHYLFIFTFFFPPLQVNFKLLANVFFSREGFFFLVDEFCQYTLEAEF